MKFHCYPSVKLQNCKKLAKQLLDEANVDSQEASEMQNMLNLCLNKSYFFTDKYFETDHGLATGSRLSPLMAEVFLNNFEKERNF